MVCGIQWRSRETPGPTSKEKEARTVECTVCGRVFGREVDKVRHKCASERERPVEQQRDSVQCDLCGLWFRSRGRQAAHRCSPEGESQSVTE